MTTIKAETVAPIDNPRPNAMDAVRATGPLLGIVLQMLPFSLSLIFMPDWICWDIGPTPNQSLKPLLGSFLIYFPGIGAGE